MEIDVVQRIQKKRLGYFGHVVRMNPERLPHVALFGHGPLNKWGEWDKDEFNRLGWRSGRNGSKTSSRLADWPPLTEMDGGRPCWGCLSVDYHRHDIKSSQVKSSQVKSSQVKSRQVKSSQVKSSQVIVEVVAIPGAGINFNLSNFQCLSRGLS